MQITCEYCGAGFDTQKANGCCPICGASYSNNKELKEKRKFEEELKQQKIEQRELDIEQQRLSIERQKRMSISEQSAKRVKNTIKTFVFIPIILFVIIITIGSIGSIIMNTINDANSSTQQTVDVNKGKIFNEGETAQAIKFGEIAKFENIDIFINKCEVYHYPWRTPSEGFVYIRVFIINTNTSDETITDMYDEVYCTYELDGITFEAEVPTISSDDIGTKLRSGEIKSGLSRSGWLYFTVPMNAKFAIHFDDMLQIEISPEDVMQGVD